MSYLGLKYQYMHKNPFIETLVVPYIRVIKPEVTPMELMKGDLHESQYYDVEQQKHTRLYRETKHFTDLIALSSSAIKLILWIMYHIPDGSPSIRIDDLQLSAVFQCSGRQMLRMRSELIKAAILSKRDGNSYWINPRYFSSANRIDIYPECAVLVHTIHKKY